jgi:hypothetical protein
MAQSVQGWRQKWFYIKDQKSSDSDQYGLAPFDASKGLSKLNTWDASPSEAEVQISSLCWLVFKDSRVRRGAD